MSAIDFLLEPVKAFSDSCVGLLLRFGSRFGSDLTPEGRTEQQLWRERRLRDLRGLGLRSKQRLQHNETVQR
jgi:hypothetical protein